jgi:uncharacterized membrane protein
MNKTFKTKLSIPKMDCPSEEKMVRMALEPLTEIKKLNFDFKLRELEVIHNNDANEIVSALMPLNYGTQLKSTEEHEIDLEELEETLDPVKESNVLKILLAINGSMFVLEIILGLIAALTYSLYSWAAKKMIDRGVDSKASMGLIFGFGALILLPTLFFTGSNLFDESVNLYVVAYMMLIPMFLGYLLFGYALKTISASTATTLTLFEPLVAALFAVLLVGEQLAPIGWVGMVLIFVCLAVLSKTDRPK